MIVRPGDTQILAPFYITDATGAALDVAFNAAGLVAEYRRADDGTWHTIPLIAGSQGNWNSSGSPASAWGWAQDGFGLHQLSLPDILNYPLYFNLTPPVATNFYTLVRVRGVTGMRCPPLRIDYFGIPSAKHGGMWGLASFTPEAQTNSPIVKSVQLGTQYDSLSGQVAGLIKSISALTAAGTIPPNLNVVPLGKSWQLVVGDDYLPTTRGIAFTLIDGPPLAGVPLKLGVGDERMGVTYFSCDGTSTTVDARTQLLTFYAARGLTGLAPADRTVQYSVAALFGATPDSWTVWRGDVQTVSKFTAP